MSGIKVDARYETKTAREIAFQDARGEITNLVQGDLNHVAIITSKAGSVRANHWHPGTNVQHMYLVSGRYRALSAPLDKEGNPIGEVKEIIVEAGEIATVGPYIAHAYEFLEDSVFININSAERQPDGYGEHTIPLKTKLL